MSEQAAVPIPPTGQSEFVMWRLTQLENAVHQLDTVGSRGVAALNIRVEQLTNDLKEHEKQHEAAVQAAVTTRRWTIGIILTFVLPLYPIVLTHFKF